MFYKPKHIATFNGNILLKDCTLANIVGYLAEIDYTQKHTIIEGNVQLLINHEREALSCGKKSTNG